MSCSKKPAPPTQCECPCPPQKGKLPAINLRDLFTGGKAKVCRSVTLFVLLPALGLMTLANFAVKHEHERPEFVPYSYMRIRTKPFPWGDGQKSLFHNPKVNALPDGYED
jgi:cytochrome c oxidase subunit 6a